MHKKHYKLRYHLIKQWPEVLNDVCVSSMPLAYINSVKISFFDGRLWEVSFLSQDKEKIAEQIGNLITELENEIVKVDFDLDIEKLKTDIKQTTNNIL